MKTIAFYIFLLGSIIMLSSCAVGGYGYSTYPRTVAPYYGYGYSPYAYGRSYYYAPRYGYRGGYHGGYDHHSRGGSNSAPHSQYGRGRH